MERPSREGTRGTLSAERDARLRQASSLTRWTAGSAIVLVGAFAGLFANAHPGRHLKSAAPAPASAPASAPAVQAPLPPSESPAPTDVPPVVQSGGS